MLNRMALVSLAFGLCTGMTCTIHTGGDDGNGSTQTPLDETNAVITITQAVGDDQADVVATITDSRGRTFRMGRDQSVSVNDVELELPVDGSQYTASVGVAAEYTITVREPTRGVEETTVDAPGDFEITSPAEGGGASLSGFTLQWSNPNDRLQVDIRLSQTISGSTEVRTFGPYTDTGSRGFLGSELVPDFFQGADLMITVTKINTQGNVAGFSTATLTSRVTVTRTVDPRP